MTINFAFGQSQNAITESGKTVVLYEGGTWKYADAICDICGTYYKENGTDGQCIEIKSDGTWGHYWHCVLDKERGKHPAKPPLYSYGAGQGHNLLYHDRQSGSDLPGYGTTGSAN